MNSLYVLQSFGYGDIIFSQTLVFNLSQGREIIWPVKPDMLDALRSAYPTIQWVREDLHLVTDKQKLAILNSTVVPINRAYELNGNKKVDWMRAKYDLYNTDWHDWGRFAMWNINMERNMALLTMIGDIEFNLINNTFRNDKTGKIPINLNNGAANINMSDAQWEQFNLFDWTMAMIRAKEIHFVNSAMLYMLEILDIKGSITIYDRWPDEHKFPYVWYIMSKEYTQIIHPI